MNLRNVKRDGKEYYIGLDLGTGSVGWAVTDDNGDLYHFKGKPTWGSRLFPSAETAADTRTKRGQRRRYSRRRWRLNLLQELFCEEMQKVDSEFFIRMNQSYLLKEDRGGALPDYQYPFFNDSDFTEQDYYKKFPTIYHLRSWLTQANEQADIRLIYLAFHNIVKTRGNFLYQDNPSLTAKDANTAQAAERLLNALGEWCASRDIENLGLPSVDDLQTVLETAEKKADKQDRLRKLFSFDAETKPFVHETIKAILGYQADLSKVFGEATDNSKFSFSNDEKVDSYRADCPEDGTELFEAMLACYSAILLMVILKGANGGTISQCKVAEYALYKDQLKTLKALVKKYVPDSYDVFFRGEHYAEPQWAKDYDANKAQGYTLYNIKRGRAYDDFKKDVEKLFAGTKATEDPQYIDIMEAFTEGTFLKRLKTSDNGSIPYQLHLEEMRAIIKRQGKHYPFLLEHQKEIESLVTFRIPYYVGPLTQKQARKDKHDNPRFAWSVRLEGQERTAIKPWNWDEVIDKDESATAFIQRMTGTDTYLFGESVLPKCSLLYEQYCVYNELNGARWTPDGDKWHRFDAQDRIGIVADLFERKQTVSYKAVEDWLREHNRAVHPHVRGGQGETKFESKLSSHFFFCRLLGVDELSSAQENMAEKIILWNTLFEDRDILKDRLTKTYGIDAGGPLAKEQIKAICKKRFTGWGKFSRKLLTGIKADTPDGKRSIMDILIEGNPYGKPVGETLVFMEVLSEENLGFKEKIDEINKQHTQSIKGFGVDDLPGSPALKRTVNQALRIVDEIVSIAGCPPKSIFIETTRDEDEKKKGRRTTSRYENIRAALDTLKQEGEADPDVISELKGIKPQELDERLSLYFMQNGKCMYTGDPLDIRLLSSYHIDHIIPQAYTKDDSFENRVLVKMEANEAKGDNLLISSEIRRKMRPLWDALHHAGLIGDKKFNNLIRSEISDKQLKGFINRQLVETSQIVKHTQTLLAERHPEAKVRPLRASLSHDLREREGYVKSRVANDYHHAHDALLACELGRFIERFYPDVFDSPIKLAYALRTYIQDEVRDFKKGDRKSLNSPSFMVGSFLRSQVDVETGEILWDPKDQTEKIRRFLNYRDCYISRMPEITTGAFWNETIDSPKDPKNKSLIPIKKDLTTEKYGGFKGKDYAYFCIFLVESKDKKLLRHVGIPVSDAAQIGNPKENIEKLIKYIDTNCCGINETFLEVIRPVIFKYQLASINGCRLYLTGLDEVRSARQIGFSLKETALIQALVNGEHFDKNDLISLYKHLINNMSIYSQRLSDNLTIEETLPQFERLNEDQQGQVVLRLLELVNATSNKRDLSDIGRAKTAGQLKITFNKELNTAEHEFILIDQSVTGMFEKRTCIEL